jgi:large subunit ribosomal protein L3
MAGRMGGETVTVKNLTVVKVDVDNNLICVRGAVPGKNRTFLRIRKNG